MVMRWLILALKRTAAGDLVKSCPTAEVYRFPKTRNGWLAIACQVAPHERFRCFYTDDVPRESRPVPAGAGASQAGGPALSSQDRTCLGCGQAAIIGGACSLFRASYYVTSFILGEWRTAGNYWAPGRRLRGRHDRHIRFASTGQQVRARKASHVSVQRTISCPVRVK